MSANSVGRSPDEKEGTGARKEGSADSTRRVATGVEDRKPSLTPATKTLQQLAADPDAAWLLTFIRALQAIVAGRRDRTLADALDLTYDMAAEILFLIETLEKSR